MVILGVPNDLDEYVMADGDLALMMHRAGFRPKYKDPDDGNLLYFKKNAKLLAFLEEIQRKEEE